MQKNINRKITAAIGIITLTAMLSACGSGNKSNNANADSSATNANTAQASTDNGADETVAPAEKVTLKFLSNNPDRATGQGKIEQLIIDQYTKENPNVTINVETVDQAAYDDKIKIYNASNSMPDVFVSFGRPNFLTPLVNSGSIAELNESDYQDDGFLPGSLDSFRSNGKMYGLPKNADFWAIYYNKKIFSDNGLEVPHTLSELKSVGDKLKAKGIIPISLAGKEQWVLGLTFNQLLGRTAGSNDVNKQIVDRTYDFKGTEVASAAQLLQDWQKDGLFGEGVLNVDYGGSKNVFGQGKAAMFIMGEWEMGMAADENYPEDFRNNIGAFAFPASDDGNGKSTDLVSWFGGGYSVSATSPHLDAAKAFLAYLFKPENWAKNAWQTGAAVPAQKYDQFFTGTETELQKELTNIFVNATSLSGMTIQDAIVGDGGKLYLDNLQKVTVGKDTPAEFQEDLHKAMDTK